MQIIERRSAHYSPRYDLKVKHIVVHGTDSPANSGEAETLSYLVRNERQVSCHEYVFGQRVYSMVPDDLSAHTVGFSKLPSGEAGWRANAATWSIEGHKYAGRPMDDVTRATQQARVVAACKRFGFTADDVLSGAVLFHREIDTQGKTCPGADIDAHKYRQAVAAALRPKENPIGLTTTEFAKVAWAMEEGMRYLEAEGWDRASDWLKRSVTYNEALEKRG